jgi:dienelactone hydrolase
LLVQLNWPIIDDPQKRVVFLAWSIQKESPMRLSQASLIFVATIALTSITLLPHVSAQSNLRDSTNSSGYGEAYGNTFGKFPSTATKGDRMIADYLHLETQRLARQSLATITSKDDWQLQKDLFRRQMFEMLSLDPMPSRTDLKATVTGTLDHADFTVEKLHFQSRPGLYVTANVYVPRGATKPLPAILYVCGHGQVKIDNVSFGNKVTYQHHGAWFARNGYICIILDSVQLGEIEGIHHGTHNKGMWWWNSRGYTAAGAEAWNCIRALDYLQSRSDVDGQRIGVTGRSGGGAYSWWIAALDDRIRVACPVAGITDLQNHVDDGCVEGHCDCMYMVNTHGWDYPQVAALVAPRPLLICNTDKDRIFPLDGVVRLHSKVRRIYDLHSASDKLGLLITEGPHKDTQELQVPVMRWFNKWLKEDESPVANYAEKLFSPKDLKVLSEIPSDERTSRCFEDFTTLAVDSNSFDPNEATMSLRSRTFGAWPGDDSAGPLNVRKISQSLLEGARFEIYEYDSQPGIQLRIYLLQPLDRPIESLHLEIVDQADWLNKLKLLRVRYQESLREELDSAKIEITTPSSPEDEAQLKTWMNEIRDRKMAFAIVTPRGIGNTTLELDEKYRTHVRRRFMLLGSTIASSQVWDVHRASQVMRSVSGISSIPLHFHAGPEMTEVACFATLFEDKLDSLSLEIAPRSDQAAPDFLSWSQFVTPRQLLELVRAKTHVQLGQKQVE